jgi:hypothetical protein
MKRLQRMIDRIAPDHTALYHHRLGNTKSALPVLVADEWQNARILSCRPVAPLRPLVLGHRPDEVRQERGAHGACRACIKVSDGFRQSSHLPVS